MRKSEEKIIAKITDYQKTYSSPHGKRCLYDIMKFGNMLQPTAKKDSDVLSIGIEEGKRIAVLYILTKLKMDPIKLRAMIEQGDKDAT